jgi:heterodisulfide reductase subunit B
MESKTMKFTYYPGCSLEGTARDYAESITAVCRALHMGLEEIPDWNCCGATAAHSIDHQASIALAARTLNLAARMPHADMLVPCPMCFNRLKTASHVLMGEKRDAYDIKLSDGVPTIWDLARFFATEDMLKKVADKIIKPLKGLKVVCYYGCMASRPPEITEASDFEDPQTMDRIVENLGATAIPWSCKTDCCGASQVLSLEEVESRLVERLLDMARRVGARALVVSCQMCQANLDMFIERPGRKRGHTQPLPVIYFTELMGLALGAEGIEKCLSRHMTDPFPLLKETGILP